MDLVLHEVLSLFGGGARTVVYVISFFLCFSAALGRGFLMQKPPLLSQRFADACLCGLISIPITGICLEDQGFSIWWVWASVLCFGSMGFMVFYELMRDLIPDLKRIALGRLER